MSDGQGYEVGRGKPPKETQFRPGVSGNPKGRPRKPRVTLPYEAVLGRQVTVTLNNAPVKMSADAAFLLKLQQQAFKDTQIGRYYFEAREKHRAAQPSEREVRSLVYCVYSEAGQIDRALRLLGLGTLRDPYRPSANMVLNPLAVQFALDRLGERRFTLAEQKIVFAATRIPHKVRWPGWWSIKSSEEEGRGEAD